MEFNFVSKNYTLTPSEKKVLDKKVKNIRKITNSKKGNPSLQIELEFLNKINDLGQQYRCEANFKFYDKSIYINKSETSLRNAMDYCFADLKNQIIKDNKKYKTKIIKTAFKNKYSFLNKLLGRRNKNSGPYENIE